MAYARIEQSGYELKYFSSYSRGLVFALKQQIPASDRRWNPSDKCWIVLPKWKDTLIDLSDNCLGVDAFVAGVLSYKTVQPEQRMIRVEYIGQVKDRGNGEMVAYGAKVTGTHPLFDWPVLDWPYAFPEKVLKEFFTGDSSIQGQSTQSTLYTVLLVKQAMTQDEIKKAYRKQARRYHPDKNSDEDAHAMMQKINEAYNTLRNPMKRRKYDAGLKLEALAKSSKSNQNQWQSMVSDWSMPLRCGYIMCEGIDILGRFHVSKILVWNDIIENGRILVTSWNRSVNELRREWI